MSTPEQRMEASLKDVAEFMNCEVRTFAEAGLPDEGTGLIITTESGHRFRITVKEDA
jgi:hypothetical protein